MRLAGHKVCSADRRRRAIADLQQKADYPSCGGLGFRAEGAAVL